MTIVAAAASLLAITLAVTIGFSGQVAAITTNQGWADSYSVDGQCYCSSNFDHGVGDFEYGGESVRQICRRLGSGPTAGRVYYNTIQCGHEPAHRDSININGQRVQDEVVCPGRVGRNVECNSEKGPMWDIDFNNPNPTTTTSPPLPTTSPPTTSPPTTPAPTTAPPTTPAPTTTPPLPTTAPPLPTTTPPQDGPCEATGPNLSAAISAYAAKCSAPRQDCDPIPSGYLCSSENIDGPRPTIAPTTVPAPTTTGAPTTTEAPTTVAPTTVAPTTVAPTTVAPDPDGMVLDIMNTITDRKVGRLAGDQQTFAADDLPVQVGFDLVNAPAGAESVVFNVSGGRNQKQTENWAPWSAFGNSGSDFYGRSFGPGSYTITVDVYDGRSGSGQKLASETLSFEILSFEILSFEILD